MSQTDGIIALILHFGAQIILESDSFKAQSRQSTTPPVATKTCNNSSPPFRVFEEIEEATEEMCIRWLFPQHRHLLLLKYALSLW